LVYRKVLVRTISLISEWLLVFEPFLFFPTWNARKMMLFEGKLSDNRNVPKIKGFLAKPPAKIPENREMSLGYMICIDKWSGTDLSLKKRKIKQDSSSEKFRNYFFRPKMASGMPEIADSGRGLRARILNYNWVLIY